MQNTDNIDPRIYLAVERTVLSWVRTGLAMMGLGFVMARFTSGLSLWIGILLVLLGIAINLWSGTKYSHDVRRIRSGIPLDRDVWSMVRVVPVFLSVTGFIVVVYLVLLTISEM